MPVRKTMISKVFPCLLLFVGHGGLSRLDVTMLNGKNNGEILIRHPRGKMRAECRSSTCSILKIKTYDQAGLP